MPCCVNGLPLTKLETCCEVLTSAAAERAARMLADATGFQACAVGLQYISPLLWIAGIVERRGATGVSSLTKTLRPEVSMLVVMLAEPACARRYGVVSERKGRSHEIATQPVFRRFSPTALIQAYRHRK